MPTLPTLPALPTALGDLLKQPRVRHWGAYLVKAIVLVGLLCLNGHTAPLMPPAGIAVVWAALSAASALGFVYCAVIKKTHNRAKYREGGMLHKLNEGRIMRMIGAFVLAAVCMAGLILESPKWGVPEWILVAAAVPAYAAVLVIVRRKLGREYEAPYQAASAIKWSSVIMCVLLCAAYAAISLLQPAESYTSAADAFLAAQQPFEQSPSKLMSEAGLLTSLVNGLTAYGMSEAAHLSFPIYLICRIALVAGAFFSVANLLGVCSLERAELRRVFAPLGTPDGPSARKPVVKKYAAAAAVLPVCLCAAFLGANFAVEQAAQTEEFTAAEGFVRDQAGMAAFVLDGKYYDYQAVEDLIAEAREKSETLYADAREKLVPLINASYDARVANVDSYLDWYYSLPADYERLATMITGTAESFVAEQFQNQIEQGIDDSQLEAEFDSFVEQASQLKAGIEQELAGYELSGVPEWLVTTKEMLADDFLSQPLEPTEKLMDAGARIGIGTATGVVGGVLAKTLVEKAMTKQFCSKVVAKISSMAASRAAGGVVGGALGTIGGPLGTVAGVAAGTALGVGVDYVLLNIDEMQNRETYKQEIIATIEEERAEKLALVG